MSFPGPVGVRSGACLLALAAVAPHGGGRADEGGRRGGEPAPAVPGRSFDRSSDELVLALPDGSTLRARCDGRASTRAGGFTWRGWLGGGARGHAALAVQDGALVGVVREGARIWRLSARDGGYPEVRPVDAVALAPCAGAIAPGVVFPSPSAPSDPTPLGRVRDVEPSGIPGDATVDVLVAWTQEAEDAVGGPAATQALIDLVVLETNMAYEASGAALDLRLVFASWIDYAESGSMATDLGRLRAPADGYMDEVHAWRQTYGADAVSLLVAEQSLCGRSYNVFVPDGEEARTLAFNVVSQACASANLAFAHELGHTFGLDHDRAHTSNQPSWPFAHGFVTLEGSVRTIMALPMEGVASVRVPYYSTPYATFAGAPLGIAPPDPDAAHAARALGLNGPAIAAWFPTTVPAPSAASDGSGAGPAAPAALGRLVVPDAVPAGEPLTLAVDDPWERIPAGALVAVRVACDGSLPLAFEILGPWSPGSYGLSFALPEHAALVGSRLVLALVVLDPSADGPAWGASHTVRVSAR